jgi:hypothetical protein
LLVVAATVLVTAIAACGGGGEGSDEATPSSANPTEASTGTTVPPPCSQARHIVAMDFAGFLTSSQDDWTDWINGIDEPEVRPGTPELTHAYRDRGYEILYVTTAPPNVTVDGAPVPEAVEGWLQDNGFATGGGTRVYGYTGSVDDQSAPVASITDELLHLSADGVTSYAGYTDDEDKAYALASGGVPQERLYTISPNAGVSGTTAIPGDDLVAHRAVVDALPPVCTPG